jgi:hypothetical protein
MYPVMVLIVVIWGIFSTTNFYWETTGKSFQWSEVHISWAKGLALLLLFCGFSKNKTRDILYDF